MFQISMYPPQPYILENLCIRHTEYIQHKTLQKVDFLEAMTNGFRAQNELGMELRLTHATAAGEDDALTPMVMC